MAFLGLSSAVILGLRLVAAPGQRIVGTAVTLRQIRKTEADDPKAGMVRHSELLGGLASEGDVVVIDVGGYTDVCSWGEVHSRRSQRNGVAGALIHGAVRDVAEILESGFPVACRGFSPVKSR